jgi:predicted PurR-regulated permease PerM
MDYPVFIVNIIVHVSVMTIFLTIFFFTIASRQEKNITENQINFLLNDSIKDEVSALPEDIKTVLKEKVDSSLDKNKDSLAKQDQDVANNNQKLTDFMTNLLFMILVCTAFFVFIAYYYFKWDISKLQYILISAGITLVFVALTETVFLFLIPSNYLAIDPNKVKYKIINKILVPE